MTNPYDRLSGDGRWNMYRDIPDRQILEREYSPSSCVPDYKIFVQRYTASSEVLRSELRPSTHSYGAAVDEQIDVWVPTRSAGPRPPLVAYIHGGYWQAHSKSDHAFPARDLLGHEIAYAAINYGIAPHTQLDEMVDRCRRAVRYLRDHAAELGFDANRIFLAGSSAGAHLAAMVALWEEDGRAAADLRGLILMSGVYDMRPITQTYVNDALGLTLADAMRLSPLLLLDTASVAFPSTLIVVGEHETAEFHRQTREFASALAHKGRHCDPHVIAGRNHFDLLFDLAARDTPFGRLVLNLIESANR